jgi:hypothetical protein
MPCTDLGTSICSAGLPAEACELGCALNGEDCLSADHPENLCRVRDPTGSACGTCTLTVDEACKNGFFSGVECTLGPSSICSNFLATFPSTWERGCGLLRKTLTGDTPIRRVSVWDEPTQKLVYFWDNGRRIDGCESETWIGEEPQCEDWSDACAVAPDP